MGWGQSITMPLLWWFSCICFSSPVPAPTVSVYRTPDHSTVFTGKEVNLTCTVELNEGTAIDTEVTVSVTWQGPQGILQSGGRFSVSPPALNNAQYESLLSIAPVQSSDNGTYTCTAVVGPGSPTANIVASTSSSDRSAIDAGKLFFCLYIALWISSCTLDVYVASLTIANMPRCQYVLFCAHCMKRLQSSYV